MKLHIEIDDSDPRFAGIIAALNGERSTFVHPVSSLDTVAKRITKADRTAATLAALATIAAQDQAKQLVVEEPIVDAETVAEASRDAEALAADLAADEQKDIARQEADAATRNADIGAAEVAAGLAPSDDTRSHDELLAAVREMSHEGGALWLREVQAKYAVRSLSLLSDEQMKEILN